MPKGKSPLKRESFPVEREKNAPWFLTWEGLPLNGKKEKANNLKVRMDFWVK